MFVSFEGIDGCGKTTQLRLLQTALENRNLEVVSTREPGGTPLAEQVRRFLLEGRDSLDARAEMLLFAAARAQHVSQLIRPALERGAWVLSDRFVDSSEAYQGAGLGLNVSQIRAVNAFATGGLLPDITLFVDVSPEVGAARRAGERGDRIEARGLEFQRLVRNGFLEIARREARFRVVDGEQTREQIHAQILRILRSSSESD